MKLDNTPIFKKDKELNWENKNTSKCIVRKMTPEEVEYYSKIKCNPEDKKPVALKWGW